MRDYALIFVNGTQHRVRGPRLFQPLSHFVRYDLGLTGTKVVCAEGDCAACNIIAFSLTPHGVQIRLLNSCIAFTHLLDTQSLITIEGLDPQGPIQRAMVEHFGSQCGFCTPGFVVALTYMFHAVGVDKPITTQRIKNHLTGNLCRCTGYQPIIDAALAVDPHAMPALSQLLPPAWQSQAAAHQAIPLLAQATDGNRTQSVFASPHLADCLAHKKAQPAARVIGFATDLGVAHNKGKHIVDHHLSLGLVPSVHELALQKNTLVIGARVALADLAQFVKDKVPELARFLNIFASPPIKSVSTLAGNVVNASPIADTVPFLMALDAELILASASGQRRVPITQFYRGYRAVDLRPDEILTTIRLPLPPAGSFLRSYKISVRRDLDIATVNCAIDLLPTPDRQSIANIRIAYGGVGPTTLRLSQVEAALAGQPINDATVQTAQKAVLAAITPIGDVRSAVSYRRNVSANLIARFFADFLSANLHFGNDGMQKLSATSR